MHIVKVEFNRLWWMLGSSSIVDSRLNELRVSRSLLGSGLNPDLSPGSALNPR